jgi:DedD protein
MTTDARDARGMSEEGFHEIQLSGKQLVFLFMATTVVSIVIFLCGVLVGRGVRGDVAPSESPSVAAETADTPAAGTATLGSRESTPAPPKDEPIPVESANPGDLSYPERLANEKPPREALKPGVPPQTTAAAKPAPGKATGKPADEAAEKASTQPAGAPLATAAPRDGRYVVQVAALRERSEAEVIARRLSSRGYQAYVDASNGPSVRMYRVRVGAFKDRREADRVRQKLERVEQFKPWVTTR